MSGESIEKPPLNDVTFLEEDISKSVDPDKIRSTLENMTDTELEECFGDTLVMYRDRIDSLRYMDTKDGWSISRVLDSRDTLLNPLEYEDVQAHTVIMHELGYVDDYENMLGCISLKLRNAERVGDTDDDWLNYINAKDVADAQRVAQYCTYQSLTGKGWYDPEFDDDTEVEAGATADASIESAEPYLYDPVDPADRERERRRELYINQLNSLGAQLYLKRFAEHLL